MNLLLEESTDTGTDAPPRKRWEIPEHGEFFDLEVAGKLRSVFFLKLDVTDA